MNRDNQYGHYILGIPVVIAFCIRLFVPSEDPYLATWALLSLTVVLMPLVSFLFTQQLIHFCLFIPLFMTWLYFLAPYLYAELPVHSYRRVPRDHLPAMAMYSAFSIFSLVLGYYTLRFRRHVAPISSREFTLPSNSLGALVFFFIVLGLLSRGIEYYYPRLLRPFGELLQVLDFAPVLAICTGFLYFLRGGRQAFVLGPISAFFVFEILLRVSETLFSKIAFIMAGLVLVFIIERKRVPWLAMGIGFLIAFPVFQARTEFRMEAHNRWYGIGEAEQLGIPGLLWKGTEYFGKSYRIWDWGKFGESVESQASSRFENVSYLGQCVYMVEDMGKPLKYGNTFWWLPLTPVPRLIFPSKPPNYHPTLLAAEYGCKGRYSKAAMNFPMLVEMFINFGFAGMVVLSFLQGGLYRWCLDKVAFGVGDLNTLAFINMLWHLEKVESNITMIFGGIFQVLITWWLIAWVLKLQKKPKEIETGGTDLKEGAR